MRNHWYEAAARHIREALDALPPDHVRGDAERAKYVIAQTVVRTMPPEPGGAYAYEHWHQARKDVLAERFPDLFPKHKKETDGRLF